MKKAPQENIIPVQFLFLLENKYISILRTVKLCEILRHAGLFRKILYKEMVKREQQTILDLWFFHQSTQFGPQIHRPPSEIFSYAV
jgi:hypothetical protein